MIRTVFMLALIATPTAAFAIAGGQPVTKGEIPFVASLKSTLLGFHCGASVIAPTWVLTAAHCVTGPWSTFGAKVAIGEDRSEVAQVKSITLHPLYAKARAYSYDFALIELKQPTLAPPIHLLETPISVPPNDEVHAPLATVAGWGATRDKSLKDKNLLLATSVPLVAQERCLQVYGSRVDSSMICAGYEAGGYDSCDGDSGGPLFVKDEQGIPVLVGLVSDGDGCARPHKPGFYARVEVGLPWIREVVGNPTTDNLVSTQSALKPKDRTN